MPSLNQQTIKRATAPAADHHQKPQKITSISPSNWVYVFKRSFFKFLGDGCTDLAASLTYFSVLSIFPALLAIVSLLGVFGQGQETTDAILGFLDDYAPAEMLSLVSEPITQLTSSPAAGFALFTGIIGALWTASGYVGGFGRALNKIYGVAEGRPFFKLKATMLTITTLLVIMVVLAMLILLTSGTVLNFISDAVPGLELAGFAAIWSWLRWPVLFLIAVAMVTLLYYGTPNVKQPRLRWLSAGSLVAITGMAASGLGFSFYVSNFGNYNATYGLIGGVIVMLLFLWIMNNVLLFGAQIDAELERTRELKAGIKAEVTIQLPTRDARQAIKAEETKEKLIDQGRQIRLANNGIDFQEMAKDKDKKQES